MDVVRGRVKKDWTGPNYARICVIGEQLRHRLHTCKPPVIANRRYLLRVYKLSFIGQDLVDWLVKNKETPDRGSAIRCMRILQEFHVIHHVCDDHVFKDEYLFYRFRKDDNSFPKTRVTAVYLKAEKLKFKLFGGNKQHPIVRDIKDGDQMYKQCFSGKDVVDVLVKDKDVKSRKQAVAMCKDLVEHGILRHVKEEEDFNDNINLWYQFTDLQHLKLMDLIDLADERRRSESQGSNRSVSSSSSPPEVPIKAGYPWNVNHSPLPSPSSNKTGYPWDFSQSVSGQLMLPANLHLRRHSSPMPFHEVDSFEDLFQEKLPTNFESDAEWSSERSWSSSGDSGTDVTAPPIHKSNSNSVLEKFMSPESPFVKKDIRILSDAVGFGFVVRGSRPTHVQTIDPSSPAAAAGLKVGQYITSVNDINVAYMDHTHVARVILSIPSVVNLTVYENEKK